MAGITKDEVKSARDALLAKGINPSVDAVRVELKNTGSKTTINKYLKQLKDEDDGVAVGRDPVTAAVLSLVERLSAELHAEADATVEVMKAEYDASAAANSAKLQEAQGRLAQQNDEIGRLQMALAEAQRALEGMKERLTTESTAKLLAQQQITDLRIQLQENEAHRLSLEEKHEQARVALEHYRASVKEQREADSRRHEHQVQQLQADLRVAQQSFTVKQEEATRLNAQAARLQAEIAHLTGKLAAEESKTIEQQAQIDSLRVVATKHEVLMVQLKERDEHAVQLVEQLEQSRHHAVEAQLGTAALQRELAIVQLDLQRSQATADALAAEKQTWIRERVELEQLARGAKKP